MAKLTDFEMTSITGEPIRLSEFEGQVSLVVNVATR
jgi:glutathione peroxidase-family protein